MSAPIDLVIHIKLKDNIMGAQQSNPVGIGAHSTAKQVIFLLKIIVKRNSFILKLFWF